MRMLLLNISLGLSWLALTGEFTPDNFLGGLILSYLLLFFLHRALLPEGDDYFRKVPQVPYFIVYFLWELLLANLRVTWEVITPGYQMTPGIIKIPLDLKTDLGITVLANMITLTPGTLSLEVDRSGPQPMLYVHSMYVKDVQVFQQSIKQGFERRVMELFE